MSGSYIDLSHAIADAERYYKKNDRILAAETLQLTLFEIKQLHPDNACFRTLSSKIEALIKDIDTGVNSLIIIGMQFNSIFETLGEEVK